MTVYKAKLMDVCKDRTGEKVSNIILGRFLFAKDVEKAIKNIMCFVRDADIIESKKKELYKKIIKEKEELGI